jgi:hypothetical protein
MDSARDLVRSYNNDAWYRSAGLIAHDAVHASIALRQDFS